jgi:hypothetical protein
LRESSLLAQMHRIHYPACFAEVRRKGNADVT